MASNRNLASWLPGLKGLRVQNEGVELPVRGAINILGVEAEDDPDNDAINLDLGLLGGNGAESVLLSGAGSGPASAFLIGDVVCSGNAADDTVAKLATSTNLADAGVSELGILLETGTDGETKLVARDGDKVAASVLGFSLGATADTVVVDTATGRALRVANAAVLATDTVLGYCDKRGNTTIRPRPPGTIVETTTTMGYELCPDGTRFVARKGKLKLRNIKYDGAFPDETGAVRCDNHVRLMLGLARNFSEVEVPTPDATNGFFRLEWSDPAPQTFTVGTANVITFATNLPTGTLVTLSTTGTLPTGLTATDYWIIRLSSTTASLATTAANALAGTAVAFTVSGSGTHTVLPASGPICLWDDIQGGNKKGIAIVGEGPVCGGGGFYHFRTASKIKRGTAASITARTNGGPLTVTGSAANDTISYSGLDMPTGVRVTMTSTGTLPSPLVSGTAYYTIRVSATECKLAASWALANAGTFIPLTTDGSGTITLVPGAFHQTWTVDPAAGITARAKARWMGRFFKPYGCADDENHGWHMIVDVPADNTLRVSNRNTGAPATDANNGAISWWIEEPLFDLRGSDNRVDKLRIGMVSNGDVGTFLEENHAPRPGARVNTRSQVVNCWMGTDSAASSGVYTSCITVARDILSLDPAFFDARGLNGLGEYQHTSSAQTSEGEYFLNTFLGVPEANSRMAIEFYSTAGQSKNNIILRNTCVRQNHGVGVPVEAKQGGSWTQLGIAHFDVYGLKGSQVFECLIQAGSTTGSCPIKIEDAYIESSTALFKGLWLGTHGVEINRCYLIGVAADEHPSGAWIDTGARHLIIRGGGFERANGHTDHILHRGTQTNREATIRIENFDIRGTGLFAVEFGRRVTTLRGPYDFGAGGQDLVAQVDSSTTRQTVTFSQANFNTANGYTVNLRRASGREVAKLLTYFVTGAKAWDDNDSVWMRSTNNTVSGQIKLSTAAKTSQTFTADSGTNTLTVGTDIPDLSRISMTSTGTLPGGGLSAGFDYWWIRLTATTGRIATSLANAMSATAFVITTNGTGTMTIVNYRQATDPLNANIKLGFGLDVASANRAQTRMSKDSAGLVDHHFSAGSTGKFHLILKNVRVRDSSTEAQSTVYQVDKHINSSGAGDYGGQLLEGVVGLSKTNGVPPKTFWGEVTHTGSAGTSTFTANAGTDVITFDAGVCDKFTKVQFTTTTTLPGNLALATDYWLIKQTGTTAKVASSLANAIAGTAIDILDAGTGTHTLTVQAGGSTFSMTLDQTEEDALYTTFHSPVSETGSPAAGSDKARRINRTTTDVTFTSTDPGVGSTVTWHIEVRR